MRKISRKFQEHLKYDRPCTAQFTGTQNYGGEVLPDPLQGKVFRASISELEPVQHPILPEAAVESSRKFSHYFKNVKCLGEIDVYRVIRLFGVTDPALAHAVKKLLVAGGRGAGKSQEQDVCEAISSCQRFLEMNEEDVRAPRVYTRDEATEIAVRSTHQGISEGRRQILEARRQVKSKAPKKIVAKRRNKR